MRDLVWLLVLGAVTVGTVASVADNVTAPPPGFQVHHWRSEMVGQLFNETFVVHDVTIDAAVQDIVIHRGQRLQPVTWGDQDGRLSVGDTFWFELEAFDVQEVLWATWQGQQVMECRFGGGAAMNIHPDDWAGLGMLEQVRCLDDLDDH